VLIELQKTEKYQLYDLFLAADRAKFRITHKERNQWGCEGARCVSMYLRANPTCERSMEQFSVQVS
jgi:hypothetical protein